MQATTEKKATSSVDNPFLRYFLMVLLALVIIAYLNRDTLSAYLNRVLLYQAEQAEKAAYKKRYHHVNWDAGDGKRLKMRIPRKYITKIYPNTEKNPQEMITMRVSYPGFQTLREARQSPARQTWFLIHLDENTIDPKSSRENALRRLKREVEARSMYRFSTPWGLDNYKQILCIRGREKKRLNIFVNKLMAYDPYLHREELPSDCWLVYSPEEFISQSDEYPVRFHCSMTTPENLEHYGGCSAWSAYKNKPLSYASVSRKLLPEWQTVHESIIGFLDQFIVTQ